MPMPYNARNRTNTQNVGARPVNTVQREKYSTQSIKGRLRPNLSANAPKNNAPTGRIARVNVRVYTTSAFDTWNLAASVSNRNTTTKKSKASSTQPRRPEVTANFQPLIS